MSRIFQNHAFRAVSLFHMQRFVYDVKMLQRTCPTKWRQKRPQIARVSDITLT